MRKNPFLLGILKRTEIGERSPVHQKSFNRLYTIQHLVFCKTIRSETEVAPSHLLFTLLALHTLLTCQLILPYGLSAMVTWLSECIDVLKRQNSTIKQAKRKDLSFFSVQLFTKKSAMSHSLSLYVILNLLFWPVLPSKADPTATQLKK